MAPSSRSRLSSQPGRARFGPLLNTVIVAAGYLLSRVLGLARDVIISSQFGTSAAIGAYRATFSVIDLIYIVIAGGALGSAFIPVFSGLLADEREDDAWRLASGLLKLALIGLIAACILIGVLAHPIVALTVGSGFTPVERDLTVLLLRLMLVQPVLLGIGGLAKATLETFDRFALPAIGSNLYNLGIIGGALLAPWFGIYSLVGGVIAGALLFLLVQLPGLRDIGARFVNARVTQTAGLKRVGQLLGPRLFGQAAWQINQIAVVSFASTLGAAAVAANGYALTLMLLPHGLVALSVGTVMFPQLARLHAAGDTEGFRATALGALRQVLFLALPAAVVLFVLGPPIVRALFERGAFDMASTALTTQAVAYYMLGLPAFAAAEIVVRAFYAMHDTRTPVIVGVATVALNIGLGWALLQLGGGLSGLALSFSIANIVEAGTLLVLLRGRLGHFVAFWRGLLGMSAAAFVCGAVLLALRLISAPAFPFIVPVAGYRWPQDFVPLALWLAVACIIGALAYASVALVLRLPEMQTTLARVASLLGRVRRSKGETQL